MTGDRGVGLDVAPLATERSRGRRFLRWTDADVAGWSGRQPWRSPEVALGLAATEVVVSWTAHTPSGTWLDIELQGRTTTGQRTPWFVMGRWASGDDTVRRSSVSGQGGAHGDVLVDRYLAAGAPPLTHVQVRVTPASNTGTTSSPQLRSVAIIASEEPTPWEPSAPGDAVGVTLDVPGLSQNVHRGEYPHWDSGGEAWCSPTSTAMVAAFWGAGPSATDCAWVDPGFADPWVHHAVRGVYDYSYEGAGNWAFNIAYAGTLGLTGCVTRLRSLAEAESFIAAGIPLVLSLSVGEQDIDGLDYVTRGHLLVLAGFDDQGDPVLNDPASPDNASVRKTVPRAQLERAWQSSSAGIVYVIHPPAVALPGVPGATS